MAGVVAAGQHATAAAALEILEAGGNAVDAAIAACAMSFVAEPLLTSAGGGGLMTVCLPDVEPLVIDFFANAPGLGEVASELDFFDVTIDFGTVTQDFHIGRGSAAVPGVFPGLAEAHRRFASRELADLVAPAQQLARAGVKVTAETAHTFTLLWPLLCGFDETVDLYGGGCPRVGESLSNPALADTLADFASTGDVPARVHDGILERFGAAHGGMVSDTDLRGYEVHVRAPLEIDLGRWIAYTSPLVGGELVAVIARRLAAGVPAPTEAEELVRLAKASAAGHAERRTLIAPGSTTHISVIDDRGGAVALTLTNGESCGELIPGTGVLMNNFLGEEDLNPHGFHQHPAGVRLPTMMAPTIGTRDGLAALALGSGGSNRIRTAVGQVLYRVACLDASIESAVVAPRAHAEDSVVWVELAGVSESAKALEALAAEFATVHPFAARDFFFGGVHAVFVDTAGAYHGAGDKRRGGTALIL